MFIDKTIIIWYTNYRKQWKTLKKIIIFDGVKYKHRGKKHIMKVYKFKIKLKDFEDKVYREIEFSENSSVAKLAYAILVSFDTDGSHLYNIEWKNNHFENIFDTEEELINGINFYLNPSLYHLHYFRL